MQESVASAPGRCSSPVRRPLPMVEILVRDPGNCPVVVAGQRMAYAHPEIVGENADRVCGQSLAALAPAAEEVARAAADGRVIQPFELTCPLEGCGAVFLLRVVPYGERSPGRESDAAAEGPESPERRSSRRRAGRRRRRGAKLLLGLVLLLVLLGGGAFAGVAALAPQLLPDGIKDRLRSLGVPVPYARAAPAWADPGEAASP